MKGTITTSDLSPVIVGEECAMVARSYRCDAKRLRLLLDDRLEEDEQAELSRHLETCASCRRGLEQLAAESRWWGDARLLSDEVPPTCGPEPSAIEAPPLGFLEATGEPGLIGKMGPYEVVEVIGRGGMGVVVKAFDRPLGRYVAIKVLAPELTTSATARRRFAREAQAAAAIAHEHIVAIYAVDATASGFPYIVMQYVSGRSLQDRLDKSGPLDLRGVLRIGKQAASGLAAAHAVGLVHRDVKPANILLENCIERVKLSDFGLARAADDASLTQSGVVAGTPQYMAPEQARGESIDHRADLFSLGSVLYALCTGRPPFRAETTMGVLRRVCEDTPRPIQELNPDIPDWLQAIVARLLAKSPADRFQTAAEVSRLLGRCLAYVERPGDQPAPYRTGPAPDAPRPWRGWLIGLAALLLILVGLGTSEAVGVSRLTHYVATVLRIETDGGQRTLTASRAAEAAGGPNRESRAERERALEQKYKDAKIKQLQEQMKEMQTQIGAYQPLDPRVKKYNAARRRLEELRLVRGENDPVVVNACKKVQQLEEDLRLHPARSTGPSPSESPSSRIVPPRPGLTEKRPLETETAVFSIAVAPDGQTLAVACWDGSILLFDLGGGKAPRMLKGHKQEVRSLAFSPDGGRLASAGGTYLRHDEPGELKLWELAGGRVQYDLKGHTGLVWSVAFSPDGTRLASGSWDKTARLWDVATGAAGPILKGHTDAVRSVAFAPTGTMLATAGFDGDVKFWNNAPDSPRDGTFSAHYHAFDQGVNSIAFAPDAQTLAISPKPPEESFRKDEVILLDLPHNQARARLKGHANAVLALAFSPDGKTLVSGGGFPGVIDHGGDILFWDAASGEQTARFADLDDPVESLRFTPDGRTLVSGGGHEKLGGEVRFRDASRVPSTPLRPEVACRVPLRAGSRIWSLAYSPDGRTLAVVGGNPARAPGLSLASGFSDDLGFLGLVRLESGPPEAPPLDESRFIRAAAFSPDGKLLATAASDGRAQLRDPETGRVIRSLEGHESGVLGVAFTPDGKTLATAGLEGTLRLWDVASGAELRKLSGHEGPVLCVAVSPDGLTVASGGADGKARLWDLKTGRPRAELDEHDEPVEWVTFAPDGQRLATAGRDGTVNLWDTASGRLLAALSGHGLPVLGAAFSPDGTRLATCAGSWGENAPGPGQGELKLWDSATGAEIAALPGHADRVFGVAFAPDGQTLASAGWDGVVLLWDLSP